MLTISVEVPGLRDLLGRFAKWESELARFRRQEAAQSAVKMTTVLQRYAPKRTGRFSRSLYSRVLEPGPKITQIRFYSNDPKAQFVIYPTRAHLIRARGKALRFNVSGRTLFRAQVMHPGTKGSDFVSRAVHSVRPEFIKAMNRVGVRAVVALAGARR